MVLALVKADDPFPLYSLLDLHDNVSSNPPVPPHSPLPLLRAREGGGGKFMAAAGRRSGRGQEEDPFYVRFMRRPSSGYDDLLEVAWLYQSFINLIRRDGGFFFHPLGTELLPFCRC